MGTDGGTQKAEEGWDFFVSYTDVDGGWAEWVAWQLEDAGYQVLVEAWDTVPGSNKTVQIQEGITRSGCTIALLSPIYLNSVDVQVEWLATQAANPSGSKRKLVPIRIAECSPSGLLGPIESIDLFGLDEDQARDRLLKKIGVSRAGRAKPGTPPGFPGQPTTQLRAGGRIRLVRRGTITARKLPARSRRGRVVDVVATAGSVVMLADLVTIFWPAAWNAVDRTGLVSGIIIGSTVALVVAALALMTPRGTPLPQPPPQQRPQENPIPHRRNVAATLTRARQLDDNLRAMLIQNSRYVCMLCHRASAVDVYHVGSDAEPVVLCAKCVGLTRTHSLPAENILLAKSAWLEICRGSGSAEWEEQEVVELLQKARRFSLSTDLKDVREALLLCRRILAHDPFHLDARLLADRLRPIDPYGSEDHGRMWAEVPRLLSWASRVAEVSSWRIRLAVAAVGVALVVTWQEIMMHASLLNWLTIAWLVLAVTVLRPRWTVLTLYLVVVLDYVILHESGHLIAGWYFLRDYRGCRMPFLRCFRYLELDIDGQRLDGGVREAIVRFRRDGRLPSVSANISKMEFDWRMGDAGHE